MNDPVWLRIRAWNSFLRYLLPTSDLSRLIVISLLGVHVVLGPLPRDETDIDIWIAYLIGRLLFALGLDVLCDIWRLLSRNPKPASHSIAPFSGSYREWWKWLMRYFWPTSRWGKGVVLNLTLVAVLVLERVNRPERSSVLLTLFLAYLVCHVLFVAVGDVLLELRRWALRERRPHHGVVPLAGFILTILIFGVLKKQLDEYERNHERQLDEKIARIYSRPVPRRP